MLTSDETAFLTHHSIAHDEVHDGRNQSKLAREHAAREANKILILTNARCGKNSTHRLRTRSGHCFQCNPTYVTFQTNYRSKKYLYVAGSLSGRAFKIGISDRCTDRVSTHRAQHYGGLRDWELIEETKIDNAGETEARLKAILKPFATAKTYFKSDIGQSSQEMFSCSFKDIRIALYDLLGTKYSLNRRRAWDVEEKYNF